MDTCFSVFKNFHSSTLLMKKSEKEEWSLQNDSDDVTMNSSEVREIVRSLNLIDDDFFQFFARDKDAVEEMLQILLNDPNLKVETVHPQEALKNLSGRSVILDALVQLSDGRLCNVEVQKRNDDDHQRRVRYNASCISTAFAEAGKKFKNLHDVIVVFISKFDVFKKGYTVYHVDRILRETGDIVHNGLEEVYINTAVDDGTKIARLMDYFLHTDGESDEFRKIGARCQMARTKEGENSMCEKVEEYVQKVAERVTEEVTERVTEKVGFDKDTSYITSMHNKGIPIIDIAEIANMSEEDVRRILRI